MTITAKRYLQLSLLAPIAIPALLLPFSESMIAGFMWISLIIGGVPYIVFALGTFLWSRSRSEKQLVRFSYVAPFFYAVLLVVFYLLYSLAAAGSNGADSELPHVLGLFAAYGIGVGYFYVLLVNLGYHLIYAEKGEP